MWSINELELCNVEFLQLKSLLKITQERLSFRQLLESTKLFRKRFMHAAKVMNRHRSGCDGNSQHFLQMAASQIHAQTFAWGKIKTFRVLFLWIFRVICGDGLVVWGGEIRDLTEPADYTFINFLCLFKTKSISTSMVSEYSSPVQTPFTFASLATLWKHREILKLFKLNSTGPKFNAFIYCTSTYDSDCFVLLSSSSATASKSHAQSAVNLANLFIIESFSRTNFNAFRFCNRKRNRWVSAVGSRMGAEVIV